MPGPSCRRLVASLLAALLLCALGRVTAIADPRSDPTADPTSGLTSWGTAGASYSGGVLCTLNDGTRVPLAHWQVDGRPAFATADVLGTPAGDGPAPVSGPSTPMTAGQDGLDARTIAVLAELIARRGTGSPAQTAEVSAAVAAAFGSGATEARCLGQQGTSATDLDALRTEAQRYAGPYQVSAAAPAPTPPGTTTTVAVTVRSATGVVVPGVAVTVSGAGRPSSARTTAQGVASVSLTTPTAASTPITASVAQTTGLLFTPGTPGSVALGPASTAVATGILAADLHPHPTLHIDVGGGLLAEHGVLTPTARVSGTYGFAGSGTVTLAGPAEPGADGSCSTLPASAFAAAPNAWSHSFTFAGDGAAPVGSSPGLATGCYVAGGSLTVTGVDPVATAGAPFEDTAIVDVVRLDVQRSAVPVLTLPGAVASTVTVDAPADAELSSTATVFGPLAPRDGRCDTVQWAGARVLGTVEAQSQPADGDVRSMVLRTPTLADLGCYAVRARTTVERDGRRLTVQPALGAPGTVVLVMHPSFTLVDDTYDTTLGIPMRGGVTVSGTYRYPATLSVRLRSAAPRFDGCRSVSFRAGATGAATAVRTGGDGAFAFRTPAPSANTCYAIEATLQMVDNANVRVDGPAPARPTIFLAGRAPDVQHGPAILHSSGSTLRADLTLLGSVLLMLVVAAGVLVRVALGHGAGDGNRTRTVSLGS